MVSVIREFSPVHNLGEWVCSTTCLRSLYPKKVSPILGSKSLLRWTLLLGVPPGEKWPVNHVRGQRWILWYWCSGKCIIQDYKYCTYMHSHPLKCWMSSLNLEYPGTFCLNCHVECFLTRTGWIVRVVMKWMPALTHSNTQVASWLDLMISHSNRSGVCQAYFRCDPFGVWLV